MALICPHRCGAELEIHKLGGSITKCPKCLQDVHVQLATVPEQAGLLHMLVKEYQVYSEDYFASGWYEVTEKVLDDFKRYLKRPFNEDYYLEDLKYLESESHDFLELMHQRTMSHDFLLKNRDLYMAAEMIWSTLSYYSHRDMIFGANVQTPLRVSRLGPVLPLKSFNVAAFHCDIYEDDDQDTSHHNVRIQVAAADRNISIAGTQCELLSSSIPKMLRENIMYGMSPTDSAEVVRNNKDSLGLTIQQNEENYRFSVRIEHLLDAE